MPSPLSRTKYETRVKNRRIAADEAHAVTKALRAEVASLRETVERLQLSLRGLQQQVYAESVPAVTELRAEVTSLRDRINQPQPCDKKLPCSLPRGHSHGCRWNG